MQPFLSTVSASHTTASDALRADRGARGRLLSRHGVLTATVCVLVAALVYAARPTRLPITGDEPHYLILADGIVHDWTLDLRNAYARNASAKQIYDGPLAPHVLIVNHRWAPYHGPGLSLLLAIPFALGGIPGAKLTLCLLAGLLPLALHRFLAERVGGAAATWLTFGLVVCLPFLFGATQVFPDLVGGVIAVGAALWLIDSELQRRRAVSWALFWFLIGWWAWLNTKYAAGTAALMVWGAGAECTRWWRQRHDDGRFDWSRVAAIALALIGLIGLAAFHVWGVANPMGPRPLGEVASPFSRAAAIFLGLHFDQSQGMFIQHPLLLAGVAAWPLFARRHPTLALFWCGLYAALILPNSMELARWGGGGPVGRFSWSVVWLWAIPIGCAIADDRQRFERWAKPAVLASLGYQALLALRWLPNLPLLYPRLEENLAARDSLFPEALRPVVPSFYFWDFSSYWTYLPNVVAYAVFLAVLCAGVVAARRAHPKISREGTA